MERGVDTSTEARGCVLGEHVNDRGTRLTVTADLALADAPGFLAVFFGALRSRPPVVVLDMYRLDSIDGRCVAMGAAAGERMAGWGGTLSVQGARGAVWRAFGACGLGDLLGQTRAGAASPSVTSASGSPSPPRS